jgi:hypothetical protein
MSSEGEKMSLKLNLDQVRERALELLSKGYH